MDPRHFFFNFFFVHARLVLPINNNNKPIHCWLTFTHYAFVLDIAPVEISRHTHGGVSSRLLCFSFTFVSPDLCIILQSQRSFPIHFLFLCYANRASINKLSIGQLSLLGLSRSVLIRSSPGENSHTSHIILSCFIRARLDLFLPRSRSAAWCGHDIMAVIIAN